MSVVTGHVCDIGEAAKAVIPFERVSITTYPNRCGIPNEMMEEDMAHRKKTALELAHPNAVAMESTGVYWIPLYEILEARGFAVNLVNARHVKNVSGRKSDVLDCQWLQQLMSYGLLSGAFRPADEICMLRAVSRQRDMLLASQGRHIQHMQKALTQMNVQLANVISDIVGETGQKIVRGIIAGERDGHVLAKMKNARIRASEEEIAKSLQGNWREEHLFALKQAMAIYDNYGTLLAECDTKLAHRVLIERDGCDWEKVGVITVYR